MVVSRSRPVLTNHPLPTAREGKGLGTCYTDTCSAIIFVRVDVR